MPLVAMIYAVCVGAAHSYGLLDGYYFLPFLPHVLGARGRESHDGHQWPTRKEINACRIFGTSTLYLQFLSEVYGLERVYGRT